MSMTLRKRVLFLCTGNSCRSQMAEGLCRSLHGNAMEAFSAGIERHGLNPLAVKAMAEIGIDISGHYSKTLDEIDTDALDLVVTVCGDAHETCPVFPGKARVVHHGFDDPPALARNAGSEEEAMTHYRRVRDEIAEFIRSLWDLYFD
jgi:arsenate reductase